MLLYSLIRSYKYFIMFLLVPTALYCNSLESLCTFLCDCSPVSTCENEKQPIVHTYILHKKLSQQISLQFIVDEKPKDPTKLIIYFLLFTNGCHEIKLTEKQKDISVDTWTPYLSKYTEGNDNELTKTKSPLAVKKINKDDLPIKIRVQFSSRALRFGNLYKTEWNNPKRIGYNLSLKNINQKGTLKKFN